MGWQKRVFLLSKISRRFLLVGNGKLGNGGLVFVRLQPDVNVVANRLKNLLFFLKSIRAVCVGGENGHDPWFITFSSVGQRVTRPLGESNVFGGSMWWAIDLTQNETLPVRQASLLWQEP